jgi:ubiquitin-conjugating enzyme E2 M
MRPDLGELALPPTMKTEFPNPDDILNFLLHIEPDEGIYKGGRFTFTFAINQNFPHDPPKVKCKNKIYHPNIDVQGNVCLNILRQDWKPVLNLNAVIVGLQVRSPSNTYPFSGLIYETTVSFLGTERSRPSKQGSGRRPEK